MGKEHVVKYRDEAGGKTVNLDTTNGYVYDDAGNQIAKWDPVDSSYNKMLADYAAQEMLDVVASGVSGAVHLNADARDRAHHDHERAKAIRMRGWDGEGHLMAGELGTADVHQAAALPNYAAGYKNNAPMADQFAPPLLVGKPSDKYYTFAKEDAFQRAMPTIGATAAQVNEIAPRIANATFTAIEYALGGFVGTQLEAAADAPLRIRQATMTRILNALTIERELRVATLATTSGTWDSTVYSSLAAGAKWNGGASSDPIADIHLKQETSWGDVTGIVMAENVFHDFQRNAAVQKFFGYKDSSQALPNPSQMSSILQLPPIYVAKMKYINAAGALAYIWGGSVVFMRQPPQMPPTNQDDVASALTFRWNATDVKDGTASNGMVVREYFVQDRGSMGGNKVVLVHHDIETQTSKFVGGLLAGAHQ